MLSHDLVWKYSLNPGPLVAAFVTATGVASERDHTTPRNVDNAPLRVTGRKIP
jgi:hypothetical protein